jgi:protein-disulfide isomerase
VAARRPKRAARSAGRRRRPQAWWVIGAMAAGLAVGAVLIIGLTWLGDEDSPGGTDEATVAAEHVCASGRVPVDGRTCGQDSAPVTIVEYSDFLCPFCARAALSTLPEVQEEYVVAGKVKLTFKHVIVHGEKAVLAAGAAECASEQNAFWAYHDKLYLNQGSVDFSAENLKRFAEELGLDSDSFNACLESERYMDKLAADLDEARQVGVSATPSFLINGKLVVGYQPFEEFRVHIEEALSEQ